MDTVETLIEFVGSTSGGGGTSGGGTSGGGTVTPAAEKVLTGAATKATGATTKTFDSLTMLIIALIVILAISVIAVVLYKKYANKTHGKHGKLHVSAKNVGLSLFSTLVLVCCIASVNLTQLPFAAADNDFESSVTAPGKIQATVDQDSGSVKIAQSYIKNIGTSNMKINSISVNLNDGIDDNNCTWSISAFGEVVYNDKAGQTVTFENLKILAPEQKELISVDTDMSIDTAVKLIGKNVLSISCTYEPAPETLYNISFASDSNGTINPGANISVAEGSKYIVDSSNVLKISDKDNTIQETPIANENYVFDYWTHNGERISSEEIADITADTTFFAYFKEKEPEQTTVSGNVKDTSGNPVAEANVELYDDNGALVVSAATDQDGKYNLVIPDDSVALTNALIKIHTNNSSSEDIYISNPTGHHSVNTAVLEPSSVVTGSLKDEAGNPLTNVNVVFSYCTEDEQGNKTIKSFTCYSDAEGNYKNYLKNNNEYSINVNNKNNINYYFDHAVAEQDLTIQPLSISSTLYKVSLDLKEATVSECPKSWTKESDTVYSCNVTKGVAYESIIKLWNMIKFNAPATHTFVGYNPDTGELNSDVTIETVWQTQDSVKILGYVYDSAGLPVSGANVRFVTIGGAEVTASSNEGGLYTLEGVPKNTSGKIYISTSDGKIAGEIDCQVGDSDVDAPNAIVENKSTVKGIVKDETGNVLANADVTFNSFSYDNGQRAVEVFSTKTDSEGNYSLDVKSGANYNASFISSNPDVYYLLKIPVGENEVNKNINISSTTLLCTLILDGLSIDSQNIPAGWTKTDNITFTKSINAGSDFSAICDEWDKTMFVPTDNNFMFSYYEYEGDKLSSESSQITAKSEKKCHLKTIVKNSSGEPVANVRVDLAVYAITNDLDLLSNSYCVTAEDGSCTFEVVHSWFGYVKASTETETSDSVAFMYGEEDVEKTIDLELGEKITLSGQVVNYEEQKNTNKIILCYYNFNEDGIVENIIVCDADWNGKYSVDVKKRDNSYILNSTFDKANFYATSLTLNSDYVLNIDFKNNIFYKVSLKLNGGGNRILPTGWRSVGEDNEEKYEKSYVSGTNLTIVSTEWPAQSVAPPEGQDFSGWEGATGALNSNVEITARYTARAAKLFNFENIANNLSNGLKNALNGAKDFLIDTAE